MTPRKINLKNTLCGMLCHKLFQNGLSLACQPQGRLELTLLSSKMSRHVACDVQALVVSDLVGEAPTKLLKKLQSLSFVLCG